MAVWCCKPSRIESTELTLPYQGLPPPEENRETRAVLAACDFVEGLLSGVAAHLPELPITTQLEHHSSTSVALQVHLLSAVEATIATRSRIGYDVYLKDEVTFTLSGEEDVALEISGLEFHPLRDSVMLRQKLRQLLGNDFTRTSAYQWWEEHKEEVCPLRGSKLRWVIESILGLRTVNAVTPPKGKEKMLWGFLHARRMVLEKLTFRVDEDRVRMTARVEEPSTEEEMYLQATFDEMISEMPQHELRLGEYFMPSSINWLALFNSKLIGHPGADAARITKLLSAATAWGPGTDGWQHNDETWTCVDQKNIFGKVTMEQGRLLWRKAKLCRAQFASAPALVQC